MMPNRSFWETLHRLEDLLATETDNRRGLAILGDWLQMAAILPEHSEVVETETRLYERVQAGISTIDLGQIGELRAKGWREGEIMGVLSYAIKAITASGKPVVICAGEKLGAADSRFDRLFATIYRS